MIAEREVLVQRLKQAEPGRLGELTRAGWLKPASTSRRFTAITIIS